jgi:hypothetical protein
MPLTGGCLCGAVRYVADAEPLFSGNCYCRDCQKESGAGHLTAASVPDASLKITGTTATFSKRGASGKPFERIFCPKCGSTLFGRPQVLPGITMVRAGTLDDPAQIVPRVNVYVSSANAWDAPDPTLRSYPGMPPRR